MTTVAATPERAPEATTAQYSLPKILGIWAAAAIPMAILGWMVAPALAPDLASDPIGAAVTRVGVLTLGLMLFNTVLGEEFLFRGVLLPKMNGCLAGRIG